MRSNTSFGTIKKLVIKSPPLISSKGEKMYILMQFLKNLSEFFFIQQIIEIILVIVFTIQ